MTKPEELARQKIDELLEAAGWQVQDYSAINLTAALGAPAREFPQASLEEFFQTESCRESPVWIAKRQRTYSRDIIVNKFLNFLKRRSLLMTTTQQILNKAIGFRPLIQVVIA